MSTRNRIAALSRRLRAPALALAMAAIGTGCATAPEAAGTGAPFAPLAAAPGPATDTLPDVDLTGELLFRLVFAEFAVQRGEPGAAYSELMVVARKTNDPRVARRAAEVAIAARALPQALDAAQLWRATAPSSAEADQTYSSLLVATGRHDLARPILERQIAAAPNPVEILDRLQRVLAQAPEPAQGDALLEHVAARYLQDPAVAFDVHLILARGARVAGDVPAAIRHARAALALRPDSETALVAVAQMLAEVNGKAAAGSAEAIGMLGQYLERHPAAGEVRLLYARILVGEGRLEDARHQFEDLLQRSPGNPDPLFALGVLALESEEFVQARTYLDRYLAALGSSPDRDLDVVYLNLARVAEGQHQFAEALEWLHKVHGTEQGDVAREREAFVLVHLDRVDEGLKLLQALPAGTPEERTQRILVQGQLLRDAHRDQQSFDLLDEALRASPDDTGLLYESAMSAERLDRIDLMEARLRHLLQLRPDYAHAYNALGYSLADRNIRLQEAYQLIGRALALAPDDGFIVDSMGWVQFRLGNLAAAREALTRAFRLKADPDVAAHLGEVLWATGDHRGARELLLDAQRRNGDSGTLRDTLQRLKIQP
jgi:tetratricopeptide (TPR) repeat protein